MIVRFFIVILLMNSTESVFSQWTRENGPYGGHVRSIGYQGNMLLAGGDGGDIFMYSKNLKSWQYHGNLPDAPILSVVFYQSEWYAACFGYGVFTSKHGSSWTAVNNGLTDMHVLALTEHQGELYAGTHGGVFIFDKHQQCWKPASNGLLSTIVTSFASVGRRLYAGTVGEGVFVTVNKGRSWTQLPDTNIQRTITALCADHQRLAAGTLNGVYVSEDHGLTWMPRSTGMAGLNVHALALKNQTLIAATGYAYISVSQNAGQTWHPVTAGFSPGAYVYHFAVAQNKIFAGTTNGVYVSHDLGECWESMNQGLSMTEIHDLSNGQQGFWLATWGSGVYRQSGSQWLATNNGLYPWDVFSLGQTIDRVWSGTAYGGILCRTASDTQWMARNSGLAHKVIMTILHDDSLRAVGTYLGGVYRTTNHGLSWFASNAGLGNKNIWSLAVHNQSWFAATDGGGVYRSDNRGASWTAVNQGLGSLYVYTLLSSGSLLYAGTHAGVYVSGDNGQSWTAANTGIENVPVLAMLETSGLLVIGTDEAGVWISGNQGASWQAVNNGLQHLTVNTLKEKNGILYAGTRSGLFSRGVNHLIVEKQIPAKQPANNRFNGNLSAYPNPFNPTTLIRYELAVNSKVSLKIYNMLGQEVRTLVDDHQNRGSHVYIWDGRNNQGNIVSSGMYYAILQAGKETRHLKLVLMK